MLENDKDGVGRQIFATRNHPLAINQAEEARSRSRQQSRHENEAVQRDGNRRRVSSNINPAQVKSATSSANSEDENAEEIFDRAFSPLTDEQHRLLDKIEAEIEAESKYWSGGLSDQEIAQYYFDRAFGNEIERSNDEVPSPELKTAFEKIDTGLAARPLRPEPSIPAPRAHGTTHSRAVPDRRSADQQAPAIKRPETETSIAAKPDPRPGPIHDPFVSQTPHNKAHPDSSDVINLRHPPAIFLQAGEKDQDIFFLAPDNRTYITGKDFKQHAPKEFERRLDELGLSPDIADFPLSWTRPSILIHKSQDEFVAAENLLPEAVRTDTPLARLYRNRTFALSYSRDRLPRYVSTECFSSEDLGSSFTSGIFLNRWQRAQLGHDVRHYATWTASTPVQAKGLLKLIGRDENLANRPVGWPPIFAWGDDPVFEQGARKTEWGENTPRTLNTGWNRSKTPYVLKEWSKKNNRAVYEPLPKEEYIALLKARGSLRNQVFQFGLMPRSDIPDFDVDKLEAERKRLGLSPKEKLPWHTYYDEETRKVLGLDGASHLSRYVCTTSVPRQFLKAMAAASHETSAPPSARGRQAPGTAAKITAGANPARYTQSIDNRLSIPCLDREPDDIWDNVRRAERNRSRAMAR